MKSQRILVASLAVVAVIATVSTGVVIQSASAAGVSASTTGEQAPSCWIEITGEFVLSDSPLGAATADAAIGMHEQALQETLDSSSASQVPGGSDLLELRIDQLETAEFEGTVGREAEFSTSLVSEPEATTLVVEQSEVDGTWRVAEESIELPAGTDCDADQLGNRQPGS